MVRPSDWSAVDLPGDPVPGNAGTIRQSAANARSVERNIEEQVGRLNRLKDGKGWDSESGKTFSSSAGDLAGAIEKAKGRYTALAAALDEWADGLEGIQRQADAALADAEAAKQAHSTAANQTITGDPGTPEHQDQLDAQTRAMGSAQDDLDAAKRTVARLGGIGEGGEYGALADRVAGKIRDGADDGLKDHWYDHVKQWIHEHRGVLNVIKDVLNAVAIVVLVAALFIPGANILAGIALAGLVMSTITFGITAAQAFAGDATAKDVMWAAVGVAASAVGFGALKSMSSALPAVTRSVGQSAAMTAGNAARGAGTSFGAAYSTTYAETIAKAASIAKNPAVKVVDGFLTNGSVELLLVRRLAAGGAVATQAMPYALRPAITASVLGVKGLWDGGAEIKDNWNDLWDGTYWKNATAIHVGSL
jgi:hypothetical protein